MKKIILFAFLLGNSFLGLQAQVTCVWAKSAGGPICELVLDLCTDAGGNVFVTGNFYDSTFTIGGHTLTGPPLGPDGVVKMFAAKYDAAGNVLWARAAANHNGTNPSSACSDNAGNFYATGNYYGAGVDFDTIHLVNNAYGWTGANLYIVKYDAAGNVLWAKSFGGSTHDCMAQHITCDADGNLVAAGFYNSSSISFGPYILNSGSPGRHFFVAKFDPSGNVLWARKTTEPASSISSVFTGGVTTDVQNNIYVTGSFENTSIDFGGVAVNNTAIGTDVFLVKYDPEGNAIWALAEGGSTDDWSGGIALDSKANIYITGYYSSVASIFDTVSLANADSGTYDIFLAQYDSSGTFGWAKRAGGLSDHVSHNIAVDASNNVFISGEFVHTGMDFGLINIPNTNTNSDLFVASYSTTGNVNWAIAEGDNGSEYANMAIDHQSNIFLAGRFEAEQTQIGPFVLSNPDPTNVCDMFVAKFVHGQTGQKEISAEALQVKIYPNPSSGIIYLNAEETISAVQVFDLTGQQLYTVKPNNKHVITGLTGFPNGMYFIHVTTGHGHTVKRINISR